MHLNYRIGGLTCDVLSCMKVLRIVLKKSSLTVICLIRAIYEIFILILSKLNL